MDLSDQILGKYEHITITSLGEIAGQNTFSTFKTLKRGLRAIHYNIFLLACWTFGGTKKTVS